MLFIKAFPHGEGGSCVPRKHETYEGVIFPFSRFRRHFTRAGAMGDIDGSRKYQGIVTGGNSWKVPHLRHFFRKGMECYPADRPHRLSQE